MSDLVVEIGDQTVRCPAELDQRYEFGRNPGDLCLTVNGQPDPAMSRIVGVFMFTNTGWRILNPAGDGNTPRPNLSVTSPNVRAVVEAGGNEILEGSGQIAFTATTAYTIRYQIENQEPAQAPNAVHVSLTPRQIDYSIAMCGPLFGDQQRNLTLGQIANLYGVARTTVDNTLNDLRNRLEAEGNYVRPPAENRLDANNVLIKTLVARGVLTQRKWDQRFGDHQPDWYLDRKLVPPRI